MQRPPRSVNRGELEETKWGCERSRVSIKLVDQDIDFHIFRYFRHKVTMYLPSFTTLDGRDRHLSRQPSLGRGGVLNFPSGRSPHGPDNPVDNLASGNMLILPELFDFKSSKFLMQYRCRAG